MDFYKSIYFFLSGRGERNYLREVPARVAPAPDAVPVRPGDGRLGQVQRQVRVPRAAGPPPLRAEQGDHRTRGSTVPPPRCSSSQVGGFQVLFF